MVARLSEMPALWAVESAFAPGSSHLRASHNAHRPALRGRLLLERASSLADIQLGGRSIPGMEGTPLRIADAACRNNADAFIRDRVFAVIHNDGSMCLRLPRDIADDLVDNGLCLRAGKNLLTWPVENTRQMEISWRTLLHAYWYVTDTPPRRARRLWSEWVIQH